MAITAKRLSSGTLSNTKATIYTSGSGNTVRTKSIVFFNTGTGDNEVILYAKASGGTSRKIARQYLKAKATWVWQPEHPLILDNQDLLEAQATNASQVNYWISGGEGTTPTTGIIPKHLSDGTLTSAYTYTVPALTAAYLYNVILFSTTGTAVAGNNVYVDFEDDAANTYRMMDLCMRQNEYVVFSVPVTLSASCKIILTGTADVDYWIDVAEEA